jgi:hypothetical protein
MKQILLASLFLVVGCFIYLAFRQDVVTAIIGRIEFLQFVRIDINDLSKNAWVYFLLYCLPDALWYISLLLFQDYTYIPMSKVSLLILVLSIASPFVLELLQYTGTMRGTFDKMDLLTYLLTLISFIVWKLKIQKRRACLS